jgi:hypothetical protein
MLKPMDAERRTGSLLERRARRSALETGPQPFDLGRPSGVMHEHREHVAALTGHEVQRRRRVEEAGTPRPSGRRRRHVPEPVVDDLKLRRSRPTMALNCGGGSSVRRRPLTRRANAFSKPMRFNASVR